MRKLLAAVCTVAIVIAAACSKSPSKPPNAEAKPSAPKTIGELRTEIAKSLDKYHVPGCGFALVATDHVIYSGGVGQADIAAGRDVTADTMFGSDRSPKASSRCRCSSFMKRAGSISTPGFTTWRPRSK